MVPSRVDFVSIAPAWIFGHIWRKAGEKSPPLLLGSVVLSGTPFWRF